MTSQFEWNWLGYLWAFLVFGPLTYASLSAIPSGINQAKGRRRPLTSIAGMLLIAAPSTLLLALLTAFVWNWKTTLNLSGIVVGWGILIILLINLGDALGKRLFR